MRPTFLRYRYNSASRGFRVEGLKFFAYKSGEPIKFRIQPMLDDFLQAKIEDIVKTHGGLVISKIPVKGIVVIDQKTKSGEEMVRSWKRKERSERYFVDYDYVLRCADEKRMIPLEKHILGDDNNRHISNKGRKKAQRELSQEAKDKLALYLATKVPDEFKTKLSSSRIYKDLWKERERYPWVKKYSWQAFRDHYCNNKKHYDKLINYILMASPGKPQPAHKVYVDKREDIAKKRMPKLNRPTRLIVEAKSGKSQHVKINDTGRKRKFANDITNIDRENKMKSIDEMLHKPLPCYKARKNQRLQTKKTRVKKPKLEDIDLDEIEVGRPACQPSHMRDVWIDDDFRGKSELKTEVRQTESQERLTAMTANFKLELDDLRSAVALTSTIWKDDEETEDEDYVARLLGLTDEALGLTAVLDFKTAAVYSGPTGINSPAVEENHNRTEIETLAQDSHFTVEEVALKCAAFAGDLDKTRDFFTRCRAIIDELYAVFLKDTSSALNLLAAPFKFVEADLVKIKKSDISTEMHSPARNTRARKVACAGKGRFDSRVQRSG